MKYKDYVKFKKQVKSMTPEELTWELFARTGKINYYLLHSAILGKDKEKEWMNSESREL